MFLIKVKCQQINFLCGVVLVVSRSRQWFPKQRRFEKKILKSRVLQECNFIKPQWFYKVCILYKKLQIHA